MQCIKCRATLQDDFEYCPYCAERTYKGSNNKHAMYGEIIDMLSQSPVYSHYEFSRTKNGNTYLRVFAKKKMQFSITEMGVVQEYIAAKVEKNRHIGWSPAKSMVTITLYD